MSRKHSTRNKLYFFVILGLALSANAGAWAIPSKVLYHELIPLVAGEVWRASGPAAAESQCFVLDVATPGILTVEARVPSAIESEPRLIAIDPPGPGSVLARQASHLTFQASAGPWRFCASAQDPRLGLEELEVVTAFVEHVPGKNGNPDDDGGNGEDPREIEIEPDGLVAGPCVSGFHKSNPDDDGGNGEDPREIEIEPDGFAAGSCALALAQAELCHRLDGASGHDDHGDTFLCATPAFRGLALEGELFDASGDDHDVFELTVTRLETIELRTSGEVDTFGSLYDSRGYRLATGEDGGDGENFRLVKTLLPGRYFIQVESARRDEGVYRLHVDAVP